MLFSFRACFRRAVISRTFMSKQVFLVRHGQGEHNVLFAQNKIAEALALKDPEINEEGKRQARLLENQLGDYLKSHNLKMDLIVTSPMRRALMTTDIVFGAPPPSCATIVSPLCSEVGDGGCDYGSSRSEVARDFPHHDFSLVRDESWWTVDESMSQLEDRVVKFKQFLLSRPETHIAVVSHGRFLTKFMESEEFCVFWNCDCRLVEVDEAGGVKEVSLIRVEEPWEGVSSTFDQSA